MTLYMSDSEIASHYRQAANKAKDIYVLAQLNACPVNEIKAALAREGITAQEPRRKMDTVKARQLYDQGCKDKEIAQALGVVTSTVTNWRLKNGLPGTRERGAAQRRETQFQDLSNTYEVAKRILGLIPKNAEPDVRARAADLIFALFSQGIQKFIQRELPREDPDE